MPVVFVHGVPDTSEMWAPLLAHIGRDDATTLRLPGFGEPIPDGFGCTMDEYATWIAAQLEAIGEPVDLVGHDWGSMFTERVAATRPELVRTWTLSDGAYSDEFKWHEMAVQWQTPDVGEMIMEAATPELLAAGLSAAGHPDGDAAAARIDKRMTDAILALYRSAVDIATAWAPPTIDAPGLVLWGAEDPFGPPAYGERVAQLSGATFQTLEGMHWAIVEQAADAAAALEAHWARA